MRGAKWILGGPALLAAAMMTGCFWSLRPRAQQILQFQQQADSLSERISVLEQQAGLSSTVAGPVTEAPSIPGTSSLTIQSSSPALGGPTALPGTEAGTTGFRWPAIDWHGSLSKLLRGLTNVVTGWVEIPKRVHETTETSGAGAGFTYGIVRGLGYGFVRTAAGAYEVITFPVPAPPNFRPVMQPAYVFLCDHSGASSP